MICCTFIFLFFLLVHIHTNNSTNLLKTLTNRFEIWYVTMETVTSIQVREEQLINMEVVQMMKRRLGGFLWSNNYRVRLFIFGGFHLLGLMTGLLTRFFTFMRHLAICTALVDLHRSEMVADRFFLTNTTLLNIIVFKWS